MMELLAIRELTDTTSQTLLSEGGYATMISSSLIFYFLLITAFFIIAMMGGIFRKDPDPYHYIRLGKYTATKEAEGFWTLITVISGMFALNIMLNLFS